MIILPNNLAVLAGDECASKWIQEQGTLLTDGIVKKDMMPFLKPGDTAFDIGAYLGCYSFGFKQAVGATGVVHSFEPNPASFQCLSHNCPDVVLHNCALGKEDGTAYLKVEYSNPGASRLVGSEESGLPVKVHVLDDIADELEGLNRLKMIKMDVEGREPEVIAGAVGCITRFRPVIFTEIHFGCLKANGYSYHDVVTPLEKLGYKYKFLDENHCFDASKFPQLDLLFLP